MARYPSWYLVSHRHICATRHFAAYCVIIVPYPMIKKSTNEFCDAITTSIARYERHRCWASKVLWNNHVQLQIQILLWMWFFSITEADSWELTQKIPHTYRLSDSTADGRKFLTGKLVGMRLWCLSLTTLLQKGRLAARQQGIGHKWPKTSPKQKWPVPFASPFCSTLIWGVQVSDVPITLINFGRSNCPTLKKWGLSPRLWAPV